jgi:hypothetical protein
MSMRDVGTGLRWLVAICAVVLVAMMIVGSMSIFGWGAFKRATADFRGETAALEAILADPDRRISAYDHFFNLCQAIQSHETTIKALEAEEEGGVSNSRREQIRGAITANRSQRDSKINQYNSDASRGYTIGQFRDANLPDRLDRTTEETTCAN